jgi:hypothetical protein
VSLSLTGDHLVVETTNGRRIAGLRDAKICCEL